MTDQDPEGKYEALSKYARDLTAAARDGKLDPVIGRDEEVRRAIQILSRRTKNNPVLIGEPGVGKTAVAEGLAQRIMAGGGRTSCTRGQERGGGSSACGMPGQADWWRGVCEHVVCVHVIEWRELAGAPHAA